MYSVEIARTRDTFPNIGGFSIEERLADFDEFYPHILGWFNSKVIHGLSDGSRKVFTHGDISLDGLLIAKRSVEECKICTLWVNPNKRNQGIAQTLVEESLEWLGCSKPLLSIPEEVYGDFATLIDKFQFELYQVLPNYYRSGRIEYVLNGTLPLKSRCL